MLDLLILGSGFLKTNSMRKGFVKIWIAAVILLEMEMIKVNNKVMVKAQFHDAPNLLIVFLSNVKSKRALISQNLDIDSLFLYKGCFPSVFGMRPKVCTIKNNNLASFIWIMDDNSKF